MIPIIKTVEPNSWTNHRLTPGAEYEAIPELRRSLLQDQGYICAYCMRRINDDDNTRIEHIIPQSRLLTNAEKMDYSNMVICCDGAISGTNQHNTHCDRHKEDDLLHFDPLREYPSSTIQYRNDGTIESTDDSINQDLNKILNLNIQLLKLNRKNVLNGLIKALNKKDKKIWKKSDLERLLDRYSSKDENGMYPEYCGVARYYLRKKLRQYNH